MDVNSQREGCDEIRVQGTNLLYEVYGSMHFSCNFVYG